MPRVSPSPDVKPSASVRLPSKPHRLVGAWIEERRRYREMARSKGWPTSTYGEIGNVQKRVLCVYDALFKAAERRGHEITHERNALRPAWLVVEGERIDIKIWEKHRQHRILLTEEERRDPTNVALNRRWKQVLEPTGALLFEARAVYRGIGKRRWGDKPDAMLQYQAEAILTEIETIAAMAAERRRKEDERERCRMMEARRRQHREALCLRTDRRWDLVRKEAAAWTEAETMRRFVDAMAVHMGDNPPLRVAAWLKWARARADAMDPMTASRKYLVRTLMTPNRELEEDDEETAL